MHPTSYPLCTFRNLKVYTALLRLNDEHLFLGKAFASHRNGLQQRFQRKPILPPPRSRAFLPSLLSRRSGRGGRGCRGSGDRRRGPEEHLEHLPQLRPLIWCQPPPGGAEAVAIDGRAAVVCKEAREEAQLLDSDFYEQTKAKAVFIWMSLLLKGRATTSITHTYFT